MSLYDPFISITENLVSPLKTENFEVKSLTEILLTKYSRQDVLVLSLFRRQH